MYIPFQIGSGESRANARMGGRAPKGILPNKLKCPEYFLTIPLFPIRDAVELSIFVSSEDDGYALIEGTGLLHEAGHLFEIVCHSKSSRGVSADCASHLSEHPLLLCEPKAVNEPWEDVGINTTIYQSHKLGGMPLINFKESVVILAPLIQSGFSQVLQIGFPTAADATPSGDWPFGGGMFHLFSNGTGPERAWRAFWEY